MTRPVVDPEGVEVSHFISACQPVKKKILEIGCGHGSLTYQYSHLPNLIAAVDPAYSELTNALDNKPESAQCVNLIGAKGEGLPFQSHYFDIALFASSL